jgi:DNA-binding MarR family transcriptional regulator
MMSPRRNKTFTLESRALALAVHELLRRVRFDDVRTISGCGVSRTECHVLEIVALDAPLTVNEIATRIHLNKSTASRTVQSLARKKLLACRASADDGRAIAVSITPRGKTAWDEIVAASAAAYAPIIEDCSPSEREAITRLLRRIADHATRS